MERDASARTEDRLVGHVEWVRALARRLATDVDTAEDLAQDALVVALSTGPRASLRFRPWMAAVMRNIARQGLRGDARREAREERAARPEGSERLVDEVVAGRELAQAVLDLDEPYRTTLLMRFWEGAPPREIARRLDVPVATVNSRLARGLARLRERYAHDSRGAAGHGLAGLAALLDPAPASAGHVLPALSLGGLVLNAKLVLSVAVLAVLTAAIWGIFATASGGEEPGSALAGAPSTVIAPPPDMSDDALVAARAATQRSASVAESPTAPSTPTTKAATVREAAGILLDSEGFPLGGLMIGTGAASVRANSAGRFALSTSADALALSVADAGWVTVREGAWRAESAIEPVVVAAREIAVAGEVVDPSGQPIQDARVEFVLPADFATRFGANLESSRGRGFGATSDERGRFRFDVLPQIASSRLRVVREGWRVTDVEVPPLGDLALRIVLSRPEIPLSGAVHGIVVDARGDAVAEARVFLGLASTTTDERGRFGIELARAVTSDRIVAIKSGRLPALMDRPGEPRDGDTGWPDRVELVLGAEPLAIAGVVRDHEGQPRPGVRVSIADPTAIGTIGRMPATAEGLASGARIPPEAEEVDRDPPDQDDENVYSNTSNVGRPSAFWNYVTTDAEGRFEIGGLGERRYRLRVRDPRTLQTFTSDPISAGDFDAVVRLPPADVWPEVHGLLVDDGQRPLAGVDVEMWAEAYGVRARIFGGETRVSLRDQSSKAVSGEDGRFVLRDVPREGVILEIASERTVPQAFPLERDADPAHVEIEVALRCSFEVRVAPGPDPQPDGIALADRSGERLNILQIEPNSVMSSSSFGLSGGRSGVLSASSAARTLILLRDGEQVRSVPIRLRAGEANVIDV